MKEPTQEQIKKFWEWCGIKHRPDLSFGDYHGRWHYVYEYPDRPPTDVLPRIDLNNLFRYAMPKLCPDYKIWLTHFPEYSSYNAQIGDISSVSLNDPALALFWAIYEAAGLEE